tara:strand:- start:18560 stop:19357 length:798 start_codon:yes stop_codon:yes gene_type:complete
VSPLLASDGSSTLATTREDEFKQEFERTGRYVIKPDRHERRLFLFFYVLAYLCLFPFILWTELQESPDDLVDELLRWSLFATFCVLMVSCAWMAFNRQPWVIVDQNGIRFPRWENFSISWGEIQQIKIEEDPAYIASGGPSLFGLFMPEYINATQKICIVPETSFKAPKRGLLSRMGPKNLTPHLEIAKNGSKFEFWPRFIGGETNMLAAHLEGLWLKNRNRLAENDDQGFSERKPRIEAGRFPAFVASFLTVVLIFLTFWVFWR